MSYHTTGWTGEPWEHEFLFRYADSSFLERARWHVARPLFALAVSLPRESSTVADAGYAACVLAALAIAPDRLLDAFETQEESHDR